MKAGSESSGPGTLVGDVRARTGRDAPPACPARPRHGLSEEKVESERRRPGRDGDRAVMVAPNFLRQVHIG